MALAPAEIAQVRAHYETRPDLSVAAIARSAGITRGSLRWLAEKHGWRRPAKGVAPRRVASPPAPPPAPRTPVAARPQPAPRERGRCPGIAACPERTALVGRLWAAVEAQIAECEARLAAHGEGLEFEREARTLAVLARTLEQLDALDGAATMKKDAADAATPTRSIDDLCATLERHLADLDGAPPAGAGAGEPG